MGRNQRMLTDSGMLMELLRYECGWEQLAFLLPPISP
jgi:hypothetical protein